MTDKKLAGKTILMSGGSRGIGLAIALRAARDGANIALLAKTDTPHPKLEGTVHSAAEQIRAAGGNALPIVGDVRNDDDITEAVLKTAGRVRRHRHRRQQRERHRPLALARPADEEVRPHAGRQRARHVHALAGGRADPAAMPRTRTSCRCRRRSTSSPKWLGAHTGYTLAKYGMTMATLGFAAEFAKDGIAANTLWPRDHDRDRRGAVRARRRRDDEGRAARPRSTRTPRTRS